MLEWPLLRIVQLNSYHNIYRGKAHRDPTQSCWSLPWCHCQVIVGREPWKRDGDELEAASEVERRVVTHWKLLTHHWWFSVVIPMINNSNQYRWSLIYILNMDQYHFLKQSVYSTVLKGRKCCIKIVFRVVVNCKTKIQQSPNICDSKKKSHLFHHYWKWL